MAFILSQLFHFGNLVAVAAFSNRPVITSEGHVIQCFLFGLFPTLRTNC